MENGDYSEGEGAEEPPRTPMTPLHNPSKRSKGTEEELSSIDHFFCFDRIAELKVYSAPTMRERLLGLTLAPACGEKSDTDALEYWRSKADLDPELAKVIAMALSAPASQRPVEAVVLTLRDIFRRGYDEQYALCKLNQTWFDGEMKRTNKV